jgi:hypothetical protein
MKNRILNNWTFIRALYLVIGIAAMIHALKSHAWFGLALGAYFASMGLFAFGCAAGNCYNGTISSETNHNSSTDIQDVEFEEIKMK